MVIYIINYKIKFCIHSINIIKTIKEQVYVITFYTQILGSTWLLKSINSGLFVYINFLTKKIIAKFSFHLLNKEFTTSKLAISK